MGERIINQFRGLNAKDDPSLIEDQAQSCANVDFTTTKLKALRRDTPQSVWRSALAALTYQDTYEYIEGGWKKLTGTSFGRWEFLRYDVQNQSLTIFHQPIAGGALQPRIYWSNSSVRLGMPAPQISVQPAGTGGGAAPAAGTYQYAITIKRTLGNYSHESAPVLSAEVTIGGAQNINMTMTDLGVTGPSTDYYTAIGQLEYNLYREFDGVFLLVNTTAVTAPGGTTVLLDTLTNALLSTTVLPSQFQSLRNGDVVSYEEPRTVTPTSYYFAGITNRSYANMIFDWQDNILGWCDNNFPSAWPSQYRWRFDTKIIICVVTNSSVLVITEKRAYRNTSTDADTINFVEIGSSLGVISWKSTEDRGIIYLMSDRGIVIYDGGPLKLISESYLPTDYFTTVSPAGSFAWFRALTTLHVFKDRLYISVLASSFYSRNYVLDLRTGDFCVIDDGGDFTGTNQPIYFYARFLQLGEEPLVHYAIRIKQAANILISGAWEIVELANYTKRFWNWQSADMLLNDMKIENFEEIEVQGEGQISIVSYVNGLLESNVSIPSAPDFGSEENRTLGFRDDKLAKYASVFLGTTDGSGEIDELSVKGK